MRNAFKPLSFILVYLLIGFSETQAQQLKPEDTEVWKPVPSVVTPGENSAAPSDAIILFDGKDLSQWASASDDKKEAAWKIEENAFTVKAGTGDIQTKQNFGDIQLHIEWRTPATVQGEGQGRGNSGIFLQGLYELQVLDSYDNQTYSNGQAGSIYKQSIPLVNASRPPGEWQVYDVIFHAPKFNNGSLETPGRITVFHNGVLIQDNVEIKGTTEYLGPPKNNPHGKGPIKLQDHGNPVSFRNIWVRELN